MIFVRDGYHFCLKSSRELDVNAKELERSSQLALARASHPSRARTFVGVVMCHISAYPLLSAYCRSIYRYKRMCLLTRLYGSYIMGAKDVWHLLHRSPRALCYASRVHVI